MIRTKTKSHRRRRAAIAMRLNSLTSQLIYLYYIKSQILKK